MSIKADYKNEILPEGMQYRTYNVIGSDGQIIHQNIHLEKAYVPQQVGDNFGAQQINEMASAINEFAGTGIKPNTYTIKETDIIVPTTSWVSDSTFSDYPFKADIAINGLTDDFICKVITPDHTNRNLDDLFSPFVYTTDGKFSIFVASKPESSITIENVSFEKVVV